ncbi:MAG: futalosine hydrolase [Terrimonas sp.]|nr:futalosine hydrolase [Terrimonas sp.]
MNCLLVAATAKEIKPFIDYYRDSEKLNHIDFHLDILITGIGLTSTTYHLTRQLNHRKPDIVIQAGVSGCFDKNIPLGDVVSVKQDTVADQSVVELSRLKTLFDLKLVPHNQYPYKNGWLVNPDKAMLKRIKLRSVKGISVNQITTARNIIEFYRGHFNPVVESMEGAALHFSCLMEQVPFLQLRSVSNYIGERNKKKWNMADSIMNLNNELKRLFENL